MAKTNVKVKQRAPRTHNGAVAARVVFEAQLARSVLACMLFEGEFYESGETISKRIQGLAHKCKPEFVAALAYAARTEQHLRHVPLLLLRELVRHPGLDEARDAEDNLIGRSLARHAIAETIQRPDEITELLSIYWQSEKGRVRGGKQAPVPSQMKRGLAAAFAKFNAFQLAKYDRQGDAVKLRDVAFLAHVKAGDDKERGRVIAKLVNTDRYPVRTKSSDFPVKKHYGLTREKFSGLETPDTWETNLSAGADKKETFERLMAEGKLGAFAFIRNLRNMDAAGVEVDLIREYADKIKVDRILPFRFITAARIMPKFEDVLEPLMLKCLEGQEKLPGLTRIAVDVSGSMDQKLSQKSETIRMDAAVGLAILAREICERVEIYTFSDHLVQVAPRRGFALSDAIKKSQRHNGTALIQAVRTLVAKGPGRLIVISDEQANHDRASFPTAKDQCYMINVASAKNGIGYGRGWNHVDGWSEAVLDYIREFEAGAYGVED